MITLPPTTKPMLIARQSASARAAAGCSDLSGRFVAVLAACGAVAPAEIAALRIVPSAPSPAGGRGLGRGRAGRRPSPPPLSPQAGRGEKSLGPVHIHSVGANGSFRAQGKARRRRQWSFHGEPPQRGHAPGKTRSLRVAAKSAGCVVALLVKGVAIDCVARLAADAFGHNASDRMNVNRP